MTKQRRDYYLTRDHTSSSTEVEDEVIALLKGGIYNERYQFKTTHPDTDLDNDSKTGPIQY